MPAPLLPISHRQQTGKADCLIFCVMMVLDYLGCARSIAQLIRLFEMDPEVGMPASRIKRLEQWGLTVFYGSGTLDDLHQHLVQGRPCVVFLDTLHLSYWSESVRHAVLVVGIGNDCIYLDDPFFDHAPQRVGRLEFMLAWDEFDHAYAVIM